MDGSSIHSSVTRPNLSTRAPPPRKNSHAKGNVSTCSIKLDASSGYFLRFEVWPYGHPAQSHFKNPFMKRQKGPYKCGKRVHVNWWWFGRGTGLCPPIKHQEAPWECSQPGSVGADQPIKTWEDRRSWRGWWKASTCAACACAKMQN